MQEGEADPLESIGSEIKTQSGMRKSVSGFPSHPALSYENRSRS
jgi:hypothetical protein